VDAADLERRARSSSGFIPSSLVTRLLARGHEREVEVEAARGEWFCALEWARLLGERRRHDRALEVLDPYAVTGWWPAVRARAELREGCGRAEEAVALCRPHAESGDRQILHFFAGLLTRHGHGAEAFALLRSGIDDWFLAEALADAAGAAGRDEEAAALLEDRIASAVPACSDPECANVRIEPWNAIDLLAAVRERQGRIDEAMTLLSRRDSTSVNDRDALADLLARHDRIEELRAYAASEYHGHAVRRLAGVLEERGDAEGAIAAYRAFADRPDGLWHVALPLSELLVRCGRNDEAIAVVRELTDRPGGAEDYVVDRLCDLYAGHGRAEEGLEHLDALKARRAGEEEWEILQFRLGLMAECGLLDEAIELARAHPEGDTWYAARRLSGLLAAAGRPEEAVAVLERHPASNALPRAERLVDLGRVEEALRVLRQPPPAEPAVVTWTGSAGEHPSERTTEPPF